MKPKFKSLLVLKMLLCGFGFTSMGRPPQSFRTLHEFSGRDGAAPNELVLLGETLFGTGVAGGSGYGTVFALNLDGTGITNLYNFTNGADGASPKGSLISTEGTLYGTARFGGNSGSGTVFAVNTNGSGFTVLHSFSAFPNNTNRDGALPTGGLLLMGNTLYGTTQGGGLGSGTLFSVRTNDSTSFAVVHTFSSTDINGFNTEGDEPSAGLIASGDTLYGTTVAGGRSGIGTIFAVKINGTGFRTLYDFGGGNSGHPFSSLTISSNMLYGTAFDIVFKLDTDDLNFSTVHDFRGASDGHAPEFAGVLLLGGTLYGTTYSGGSGNSGTVFAVNTDGTGFTNLHNFTGVVSFPFPANSDGVRPAARLISYRGTLYGTTETGGKTAAGTIFSISLLSTNPPRLTITPSPTSVTLAWPTNAAGFTLQSTTNIISPAVWTVVSPPPVVIEDRYAVTNSLSRSQEVYRLIRQ
jgi:uncharacterized repeat protein (TIGR03803 family)